MTRCVLCWRVVLRVTPSSLLILCPLCRATVTRIQTEDK